jgi:hypothetical protein
MWERSARHNPLSMRYQFYRDNRPVLPQDPTTDWFIPRHGSFDLFYYVVRVGDKKKYLCSNNIPVNDRMNLQTMVRFRSYFYNLLKYVSVIPAVFMSAVLFRNVNFSKRILYPLTFYALYKFNHILIKGSFEVYFTENFSYFFHKYSHLAVESLDEVKDPRRQHFRLDTDSYYRQSAEEILHGEHAHHEEHPGQEAHHDTSTYYGPYPVSYFF